MLLADGMLEVRNIILQGLECCNVSLRWLTMSRRSVLPMCILFDEHLKISACFMVARFTLPG